jgi:hypothetical protein
MGLQEKEKTNPIADLNIVHKLHSLSRTQDDGY